MEQTDMSTTTQKPPAGERLGEDDLKRAETFRSGLTSSPAAAEWIRVLIAECRARAIEGSGEVSDTERELATAYQRVGELDWALRKHGVNPTTITAEQPAGRRYPVGSRVTFTAEDIRTGTIPPPELTPRQIAAALDSGPDPEIAAMATGLDALFPLEVEAQRRVLRWLGERL
jgi:hypothetical protein